MCAFLHVLEAAKEDERLNSWRLATSVLSPFSTLARQQVHPALRDLLVTGVASATSFAAGLVLIAVFGRLLGVTLLAEYLLLRRVAAWLQPLSQLGLGVALPRYVAYSTKQSPASQLEYLAGSVACILFFGSLLGVVFGVARKPLSTILFGSAELSGLMLPLFLLIFGGASQVAVYGFYRGCLNMKRAGAMQLCVAVVPIMSAVTLFRTKSVGLIVSVIGCSVIVVTVVFGIPIFRQLCNVRLRGVLRRACELLKYGASRVPGDLSNGALLAVGPVIALHYMPVSRVSYLLLGLSMLTAASVSTDPIGTVFLSKISMMLANNRISDVQKYLSHLVSATIDLSLFLAIQLIVFADVLVRAWISANPPEGIAVIRVLLMGTPFYLFYTGLRSAVDAGTIRPLNSRNVIVSLGALLLMMAADTVLVRRDLLLQALAASLAAAFALLACLTSSSLANLYGVRVLWKDSTVPIICTAISGAVGLTYHNIGNVSLLSLAILELALGFVFVVVCLRSGVRWIRLLQSMVFRPRATDATVGQPVLL